MLITTKEMEASNTPPVSAILTDLSRSGLGLILSEPISPGIDVQVILQAPSAQEKRIEGRAIWNHVLPSTGHIIKPNSHCSEFWRVGLRLDEKKNEQCQLIELLLKQLT